MQRQDDLLANVQQFPELQVFTRKAWGIDHSIVAHFRVLRDRRKRLANERSGRSHLTDADVYRALPDEAFVKSQVVLYFRAWESTYRILHEPSFWQESDDFWGQRRDGKGSAAFAVILILIVAIMKCASPKEDVFVGDTTADREAAAELVQICTTWLGQQSRKHLTLSFFQIQCLLLLAKRANCVEMKQDWLNSGDLVRLALASGMHRDPALMVAGKISVYEKEMRKRLWATIMELELQSSIETGLQSSLTSLYFDTPAPTNLPDDAFSMECPQLPAPRSAEHFTSTSYLGLSQLSLPLRIHLAQLLNTPLKDIKYFDVLHYDEQIHAAISSLPSWNDIQAEVPSLLLQLQLQQYLLLLHKPYAKLARQNRYYVHSLTAIIDTASSMIAKYSAMISRGILVLNHFRNDILRVGITISSVVYENCLRHKVKPSSPADRGVESQFAEPDPHFYDVTDPERCDTPENSLYVTVLPIDPSLIRTFCITSLELLECTKQLYEQKVKRLGTGYMEYWLLSSAVEILPAPPSPTRSIDHVTDANEDPLARCRKTLDQFTTLTSHVLALQKDPQNRSASLIRKPVETLDNLASCANALESNTTPIMYDPFQFNATLETEPCLGNDIEGPFDTLQDTQIGLGDWSFPDFWAFDLGGEY